MCDSVRILFKQINLHTFPFIDMTTKQSFVRFNIMAFWMYETTDCLTQLNWNGFFSAVKVPKSISACCIWLNELELKWILQNIENSARLRRKNCQDWIFPDRYTTVIKIVVEYFKRSLFKMEASNSQKWLTVKVNYLWMEKGRPFDSKSSNGTNYFSLWIHIF